AFSEATAPDSPTGCAAPTLVAGAIAATFVDNRMNVPADAARAPEGETYPITGTFAFRIACVIWRIDESSPPGVSSVSSTAAAPASAASAMPPSTWSATKGSTTPSIRSSTTPGAPDCASAPWAPNDTHAAAREASTAARRRIITSPPPSSHRRERKARYPARREVRHRAGVRLGDRVVGIAGRRRRGRRPVHGFRLRDRPGHAAAHGRLVVACGVSHAAPGPPHRAGDLSRVRRGGAPRAARGAPTVGG